MAPTGTGCAPPPDLSTPQPPGRHSLAACISEQNPAPLVHPNGSVYILTHPEEYGFKHGMAIIKADTWRGPYRLIAADSFKSWGGDGSNVEDPYMVRTICIWHLDVSPTCRSLLELTQGVAD